MAGWILFINTKSRVKNHLVWLKSGVLHNILDSGIDTRRAGMLKRDVLTANRKVHAMTLIRLKSKIKKGQSFHKWNCL